MAEEEKISKLWEYFTLGSAYAKTLGIAEQIPKNIDFYEGRQWPKPTESTKNIPRPVVNIVKMIVRNKKSSILGTDVKLVFSSSQDTDRADKMTAFNEAIEKEMCITELHNRLVDDAIKKGSSFMHLYWDSNAVGAKSGYSGGVRGEIIDPLNIFFANPTETDEQKQKWVLIASRQELSAAKALADKGVNKSLIVPDTSLEKHYNEVEQGDQLVTVLTRYFRIGGEVYYEKATKAVMLHAPRALTPQIKKAIDTGQDEDEPESEQPDEAVELRSSGITANKAMLYPIVSYSYEPREKSIYGLSEIEGIIPNQRAINFNLGMQLLSVQNQAWGKYIVKKGALQKQEINNTPGQVLYDHSPNGDGIKKLAEQPFSQMPLQLVDKLTDLTRTVTGSSEVMTGESISSSQSGAAIAQLQTQALKPIAELKDRFWRSCIKRGKILEQFYRLFYEDYEFERTVNNEKQEETFNGGEYADIDFALSVEAGAGTQFSDALTISLLDNLLQGQKIDFATYIELFPTSAMPFKSTLKAKLVEQQNSENEQLKAALQGAQEQLQLVAPQMQELEEKARGNDELLAKAADVVNRFDTITSELQALKIEGAQKILAQNEMLGQSAQAANVAVSDAKILASELYKKQAV